MLRPSCRRGSSPVAGCFWGRKNVFTQPGSKAALTAPKSNFRFTPESGLRSDIAPSPKSAISDDSSAQNTSGLSATLKRALNIIEDSAEATGHHQISGIYN